MIREHIYYNQFLDLITIEEEVDGWSCWEFGENILHTVERGVCVELPIVYLGII